MKLEQIKEIAKQYDVRVGRLKKAELIRSIQAAEGNEICFETGKSAECGQADCLWRTDCV
jgi:hypothetical protein